jgi:uncharacterized protein
MDPDARRLERLLRFPTDFTFQVIGAADPELPARCAEAAGVALGRPVDGLDSRPSARGRWVAVHVRATVLDADEVVAVYAALGNLDGVRMLL